MAGNGNSGRRPQPSALRLLKGRRRLNRDEPQPAPTHATAPPRLRAEAREAWDELVPELKNCGMLTVLDRMKLETLCVHVGRHRKLYSALTEMEQGDETFSISDWSRLQRAMRQEGELIKSLAAGFGLDPSDRTRLHVPGDASKNRLIAFLAESKRLAQPAEGRENR